MRRALGAVVALVIALSCTAASASEPHASARVFVDTSGSMAGFFGKGKNQKDAGKTIVAVHGEIDSAIAEIGLGSAKKCTVGELPKCKDVPTKPADLGNAKVYHELSSRLDRVIGRAPNPDRIDPNNPPPADLLDDAKLTVIVTDGMQAGSADAGAATAATAACAHGADPSCISSLLRQRVGEGYGLWIVAVLLPFSGVHFPERPVTPSYFEQAKAHLKELKFDPRNLGVTFAITGGLGSVEKSGNSTYHYDGYKPLLMIVLSRDPKIGRRFVATVRQKLMGAPIQPGKMKAQDAVQSAELAPLSPATTGPVRVHFPQNEQTGVPPTALAEFRLEGSAPISAGVSSKVWCGAQGRGLLYLEYRRAADSALPPYLKDEVVLAPSGDMPSRAFAPPVPAGPNRIRTGVNCAVLPKGHSELRFMLETKLSLDGAQATKEWWSRGGWSTENTWQMPEKLYGLEELVLPMLQERSSKPIPAGTVLVHVQRD